MSRPSEKYLKLMKVLRLCGAACGADVADPNYRVNFITICVIICITVYFIFSVYTVQLKFSENWGVLLESFCMVGSVFQGIAKLLSGIVYTRHLSDINIEIFTIYEEYEAKTNYYIKVLNNSTARVKFLLKTLSILHVIIFFWLFTAPVIMYLMNGQRYMLMQFYLPGLDVETDFGYFTTIGMQFACLVFGGFGNFAGDLFFIVFNMHVTLFADVLKAKIIEFNEIADDNFEMMKMDHLLNDIIGWHQKYSLFAKTSNKIFDWITFVQIVTTSLSIVLTLFILLTGDWPGSYSYLALELLMLYVYCGIGTLVEKTNDKFCDEIYAINWYMLAPPQQKCVLLMLMKSQDPELITVGGVMPLSVSTALQVTKSVYSIMMMILNFIE
ncbi:odorant receptor 67d-like [Eupeodes corollae]|uniref:Odorant receptor n=1 Tax=Scaeva pyrastri TaxID=219539 RepID=A0A1B3B7C0_SCAPY|nr:odorant receptor 67d-like [Eupeodes corollae]AOE48101.1 putative odorant receptor OR35 [Scaeva pyrastri]